MSVRARTCIYNDEDADLAEWAKTELQKRTYQHCFDTKRQSAPCCALLDHLQRRKIKNPKAAVSQASAKRRPLY